MVQWLGLSAFTAVAQVQSLFGEVRSHKPSSDPPKTQKTLGLNHTYQYQ